MPDFKIMLTTDLKDGGAEKKLETLKSKYEKNPIKLKTELDTQKFNEQMKNLSKTMQNAFKLDKGQLSNLQTLKTTLQEINKLSKQAQKSIFGQSASGSGVKNEVSNIQKLSQTYDKLLAKQKSIEQQMSKTSNKQSYSALANELVKVRTEADSVAKALDKIGTTKGNSNITKSLASTFQSVQKEIQSTITQIDNLFKNKSLGSAQATQLAKFKQELLGLKNISLDSILNADKQYAEMSKLVRGASEIKQAFSGLKINISFNDQIEKAKSSVDGLVSKLQTLGKSGFSDKNGIANTVAQLEKLKSELNSINPNSSNATAQIKNISSAINQCETEYKQLNTAMQSSKANFTFNTNVSKTISDLQRLRQKCVELGQSTTQVDAMEQQLKELGNVSTDKTTAGLQRIKSEMSSLKSSMTGMKKTSNEIQNSTSGVQKTFGNLYSTMSTFSLGNILAMQIQKGVYAIGSTVTELDSAFRDLMKVAPDSFRGTSKELDDLRNKAIEVGQSVAKSSVDIINSTASALQLGIKNIDTAMEYAKNVNMFANVSNQSEADADVQLKGILSAFGGIDRALKSNQSSVKGANAQYNEMTNLMDQLNYAG